MRLAAQGSAEAQYEIGVRYGSGRLLHQDYLKSFEWLSKAENQGYTDAQNALGGIYANGHGCDKDYVKANY